MAGATLLLAFSALVVGVHDGPALPSPSRSQTDTPRPRANASISLSFALPSFPERVGARLSGSK